MAAKTTTIAAALLALALMQTHRAAAAPNDCGDASAKVSSALAELAKKDSDPSRANSAISDFNSEATLCMDDGDRDRVPDALEKLLESALKSKTAVFAEWKRQAEAWLKNTDGVFKWSCAEIRKVEDALCGVESEPNETPDYSAAMSLAKKMERSVLSKLDGHVRRFSKLSPTAKELMKDSSLASKVKPLYDKLVVRQGKFRGALRKDALEGARHPFKKFAVEYGKQMHKRMESSYSCKVADKTLPSGGGRPDCFKPKTCTVIEFKPRGNRKGSRQVAGYVSKLQSWYTSQIKSSSTPSGDWGGNIMKTVKATCTNSSGQVTLRGQVKFYDRCKARYQCKN